MLELGEYPQLSIDLEKIRHNASVINELCKGAGIELMAVVKGVCSDLEVCKAILEGGVNYLGEAYLPRLKTLRKELGNDVRLAYLRPPMMSEVRDVVGYADVSLNTMPETVLALDKAARERDKGHEVYLMAELGDLRDGILPHDLKEVCNQLDGLEKVRIRGVAANFACNTGLVPTLRHMKKMGDIRDRMENMLGREIPVISGGNSANIRMLLQGIDMGINELRIGEGILCGTESLRHSAIPNTFQDSFKFKAEVIEVYEKPTSMEGERVPNAFGQQVELVDRGRRKMAILAFGEEVTDPPSLVPKLEGAGVSVVLCNHFILDVEDALEELRVGDIVEFETGYMGIMRGTLSPYIKKVYS